MSKNNNDQQSHPKNDTVSNNQETSTMAAEKNDNNNKKTQQQNYNEVTGQGQDQKNQMPQNDNTVDRKANANNAPVTTPDEDVKKKGANDMSGMDASFRPNRLTDKSQEKKTHGQPHNSL